jgi:hypothetical protein
MARQQVDGMRVAGYDRTEELDAETVVLNGSCAGHRARFARLRADGSEISRLEVTYLITDRSEGRRISALVVHSLPDYCSRRNRTPISARQRVHAQRGRADDFPTRITRCCRTHHRLTPAPRSAVLGRRLAGVQGQLGPDRVVGAGVAYVGRRTLGRRRGGPTGRRGVGRGRTG